MKCHTNVNFTPPTQLPHTFSSIVAILIHNHFKSPNMYSQNVLDVDCQTQGRLKLMLELYVSEIQILYQRA
jgi:hypothetical protein